MASKRRGRPRDEPALVAALLRGTLLVAEDPSAALTINSVVAAAGTSKPRVYRYFPSAEAAFSRVLAEVVDAQTAVLIAAVEGEASDDTRFENLVAFVASAASDRRTSWRLMLRAFEHAASDTALAKRVHAADERALSALRKLFENVAHGRGLAGGYTPDGAARALSCICIGAAATLVSSPHSATPRAETLTSFWRSATNGHHR